MLLSVFFGLIVNVLSCSHVACGFLNLTILFLSFLYIMRNRFVFLLLFVRGKSFCSSSSLKATRIRLLAHFVNPDHSLGLSYTSRFHLFLQKFAVPCINMAAPWACYDTFVLRFLLNVIHSNSAHSSILH